MGLARFSLLLFSLCLHGGLAGVLWLFSGDGPDTEEQVYQVSLAEFASPQPPAQAEAQPESPPPPPEPEAAPPEPEPAPEPPKEPEAKPISAKKEQKKPAPSKPVEKPKAPPKPAPAQGAAPPNQGPAGPQPGQMGGYAAYKTDQVDQRPSISRRAAPEYPSRARRMNIEGRVLVQMVVDTSGMPQSCTVAKADPPGYFEDAALSAARKMRFIPGKLKGRPVNTVVLLPIAFQLR